MAQEKLPEGTKHDEGKPRMGLIDSYALRQLALVLTFGAVKYEDNNWRKGMKWSRVYDAVQRHLTSFWDGEDTDPESGLPHLAHAMCGIMFLLWYSIHRRSYDDRYKEVKVPEEVQTFAAGATVLQFPERSH